MVAHSCLPAVVVPDGALWPMILTCPSCGTQYVVKDGAIPPQGRQVRCASCKHSWHQDPEAAPQDEALGTAALDVGPSEKVDQGFASADEPVAADAGETTDYRPDQPTPWDEGSTTPVETRAEAHEALLQDSEQSDDYDAVPPTEPEQGRWDGDASDERDDFSPFAERGPIEAKGRGPLLPILLGLLLIAAIGAAVWFLAPDSFKQRLGIAAAAETPLQLMMTHSDRQQLASGNELLSVSGRVINPTAEPQPVPPIQAELRTSGGKLVHSWTISPPASTLPPNTSRTFNSAEMNVPSGGDELTISLGPTRT
jgi:predicted Zn finger-like uncharacterized protein